MKICLIVVFFIFLTASSCMLAYAQGDSLFVYNGEGRRDPFAPLVSKEGKLLITYGVINSINDVILEGILYDPGGESIVILNDLVLKENDQIGGIKVEKIEEDRVTLSYKGKRYIFKTKE